jgi:hypothetical protein
MRDILFAGFIEKISDNQEKLALSNPYKKIMKTMDSMDRAADDASKFIEILDKDYRRVKNIGKAAIGAGAVYGIGKMIMSNRKKNIHKTASKSFIKQDRPQKVKEIYKALKRDHPEMPAEMKARIAARQGKPGKQKQGPPYKGPIKEAVHKATLSKLIQSILGAKKINEGTEKKAFLRSLMVHLAKTSPVDASKKVERQLGGQDVASQKLQELTNLSKDLELSRRKEVPGGYVIHNDLLKKYKTELIDILNIPEKIVNSAIDAGRHLAEVERGAGKLDIVAHEFGHAQNFGDTLSNINRPLSIGSALGGTFMTILPETRKWAPIIAGLGQIPLLAEEGRASYQAIKDLRDLYTKEEIEEQLKEKALSESKSKLIKAWGSYAGQTAEAAGVLYGLGKLYDYLMPLRQ